jgi:hypothetical protein
MREAAGPSQTGRAASQSPTIVRVGPRQKPGAQIFAALANLAPTSQNPARFRLRRVWGRHLTKTRRGVEVARLAPCETLTLQSHDLRIVCGQKRLCSLAHTICLPTKFGFGDRTSVRHP